ncbi:MAG: tetratricopeptide repeat protein [Legionellales bacterium]|nr:tetratricopeptide repeat protein [Legionellales bacterium]
MNKTAFLSILIALIMTTQSALAFSWQDWWSRPDQQGQRALETGQVSLAANLFSTPGWKGVAYYRAGEYQQAYQLFSNDNSLEGYYNRGNALAHLGKYQEAINAYDEVLKQNPQFTEASYNKALLEDLLKQQQKQDSNSSQNNSQNNSSNDNSSSQGSDQASSSSQNNQKNSQQANSTNNQQNADQTPPGKTDEAQQSSSSSQNQNNTPSQKMNQQNSSSSQNQASNSDSSSSQQQDSSSQDGSSSPQNSGSSPNNPAGNEQPTQTAASTQSSQQQATTQWLQSIPDDPGGLLAQKFLRDHENYQKSATVAD